MSEPITDDAADVDEPAEVSLVCPDCGQTITGPPRGRGSASFKLGTHRWNRHGIRGEGKKSRKDAPTDDEYAERPALSLIKEARHDLGGKTAPSADKLTQALGRALGLGVMTAAVHVVENDDTLPAHVNADELIDRLSLTESAARELMSPVGRLFAPTRLNQRYGRQIVDNSDLLSTAAELANLAANWRAYLRERRALRRALEGNARNQLAAELADDDTPQPAPPPTLTPAPDWSGNGTTTPAPQAGHVVTADDIAAMRQGRRL